MLVLGRRVGQRIVIGDGISLVVQRIQGGRVVLGIKAPRDVLILRGELRRKGGSRVNPPSQEAAAEPGVMPRSADSPGILGRRASV
jgi:carbon storage regulator